MVNSMDYRRAVANADDEYGSSTEVAKTFGRSASWMRRLIQHRKGRGTFEPMSTAHHADLRTYDDQDERTIRELPATIGRTASEAVDDLAVRVIKMLGFATAFFAVVMPARGQQTDEVSSHCWQFVTGQRDRTGKSGIGRDGSPGPAERSALVGQRVGKAGRRAVFEATPDWRAALNRAGVAKTADRKVRARLKVRARSGREGGTDRLRSAFDRH